MRLCGFKIRCSLKYYLENYKTKFKRKDEIEIKKGDLFILLEEHSDLMYVIGAKIEEDVNSNIIGFSFEFGCHFHTESRKIRADVFLSSGMHHWNMYEWSTRYLKITKGQLKEFSDEINRVRLV